MIGPSGTRWDASRENNNKDDNIMTVSGHRLLLLFLPLLCRTFLNKTKKNPSPDVKTERE